MLRTQKRHGRVELTVDLTCVIDAAAGWRYRFAPDRAAKKDAIARKVMTALKGYIAATSSCRA